MAELTGVKARLLKLYERALTDATANYFGYNDPKEFPETPEQRKALDDRLMFEFDNLLQEI